MSDKEPELTADLQVFESHLRRKTRRSLPCSFCSSTNFLVSGPHDLNVAANSTGKLSPLDLIPSQTMPVMALTCASCSFIRLFAWKPMLEAKQKETERAGEKEEAE